MKNKLMIYLTMILICSNIFLVSIFENYVHYKIDSLYGMITFSFFIALFNFLIIYQSFHQYMMRKIDRINDALDQIHKGKYNGTIFSESNDEFELVIENVNKMKEKIKQKEKELLKNQEKIQYLAYYDPLTGLYNRVFFEKKLGHLLEDAKIKKENGALLYFDLDNFKKVNDTIGHMFGDLLLKNVGGLMKKYLGDHSIIARLGGDEFVALLPNAQMSHVQNIAKKIIQSFQNPWILDDREFYITVSMGITMYPKDGENASILLKNADTAMYEAKNNGKNSYSFYTYDMHQKMLEKLEMENDLRHAIEKEEFIVYYQPKIGIRSGKIEGTEALVRWNHPTKGMISPNIFIPLAEETRLIIPIGDFVLRTACNQIKKWQENGQYTMYVSVNISVIQIQQDDFVEKVVNIIKETGICPSSLELEITENTIMQNFEYTNEILQKLRGLGIHISLDDFGKGYSSLNYLKQLEIDVLKIDKSFIDDITQNKNQQAIVKSVIEMAQSMNMRVIAEGVEMWEQFNFLKELGCDEVQGYLFSKPLCVMKMENMIKEKRKVC
ncbi:putative bifunctional diguanylate cyclase/phosphodiesterase [Inediibacterium massiliense]|uniref:putative bifunctional diguanylate cyclase/phosphodiesterase n=1 Tax=Inediibacterium massiliense TaxID=1658111 RepID=UPI0006B5AA4E|nr:EAL domain-containing protein [Inediibacterium massiliense]